MHVLTKIFVVLVALLAVATVPLVAVNATNEGRFQNRFKDAEAARAAAEATLAAERAAWLASQQKVETDLREAQARLADLEKQVDSKAVAARKAEQELAGAKAAQASMAASLEVLAQSGKASTELTDALVAELSGLRSKAMEAEKRLAQLQERYDETEANLEVADAARRKLQEEIKRLGDEFAAAKSSLAEYAAAFGDLGKFNAGAVGDGARVVADRNLVATVICVRRDGTAPLAEINAGSRDGIREGWTLAVGEGASFVGNLRIVQVDVNRAVGVIELEDAAARGEVKVGQRAVARAGE